MAGVNKVILVGNLGKDPELKHGQTSGKAVCRFSLATTEKYGGEERTEWHNIVCFDRIAEIANEYLSKGRMVYVEGRIQTRKWQDQQSGQDRYITEILVNNLTMLGGGRRDSNEDYAAAPPRREQQPSRPAAAPRAPSRPAPEMDDDPFSGGEFGSPPTEDDMPF